MVELSFKKNASDAYHLIQAALNARSCFNYVSDLTDDVRIEVRVGSSDLLDEIFKLLKERDPHVLLVPGYVSDDGILTEQVDSYSEKMRFVCRRPATTAEKLAHFDRKR